jgi:hypothetical protein
MTGEFDPRYDRRYQPGYTPGPGARSPDELKSDEAPRPSRARHHQEVVAPIVTGVADDASAFEAEPDEQVIPLEPNPFERTLLVIGAVLVIGGIAAAFWANSVNYQYYPTSDGMTWQQIVQSAAWSLTAPMVTVGLALGVGVMFRRAIAWEPPK